jgi:glycosyltransferase involved in cell wall biosynthesis
MILTALSKPFGLSAGAKLNVLFMCWRDIKNPRGGGAEVYIHEVARRLVAEGHRCTLFAAGFEGGLSEEVLDGVRIIRQGAQATVQWRFFRWWRRSGRRSGFDLVVDVVNTIPFFTPLFIRELSTRRIALFFQLCRRIWWYESIFPLSLLGWLAEPLYVRLYRGTTVITISESSRRDLLRHGIPERMVHVCPVGIDVMPLEQLEPKPEGLNIIFVGRLTASKQPEHAVEALVRVVRSRPEARLWVLGDGRERYKKEFTEKIAALGLEDAIDLPGWVPADEKHRLMREAHIIVVTSVKEGWGLIVTEAAALGTPAVVYDIDGLRDSVRDGKTGVICRSNDPDELAREILDLAADTERYERLRDGALAWSRDFTWDRTASEFERFAGVNRPDATAGPRRT